MIIFQNILFLKEFLACNCCLRLFTKIKKASWTKLLGQIFIVIFHKNLFYIILCQFASQVIKQNVLLSSYLDNCIINFKIYFQSSYKAMADRENKWGRRKYKYLNILSKKSFLDEIKTIFQVVLFDEKMKNSGYKL